MILPDVNLLIYSVDQTNPFHRRARLWWEGALSSEPVALCYPSVLGFLRIVTNRRVVQSPLAIAVAIEIADSWIDRPNTRLLSPTPEHWRILSQLLRATGVGGNLTTDAHIAAYAVEYGCTLYSNDGDFGRFPGLRWRNPITAP